MSPRVIRVLVAAVIGWLLYQLVDYVQVTERRACQLRETQGQVVVTQAAIEEQGGHRAAEDTRADARQEASDDHLNKIQSLEAELRAVGAERDGLRRATAAAQRRAAEGLAAQGQAAEQGRAAIAALGAVLDACQSRYEEVAAAADRAIAAGQLCEAEHAADVALTAEEAEGL